MINFHQNWAPFFENLRDFFLEGAGHCCVELWEKSKNLIGYTIGFLKKLIRFFQNLPLESENSEIVKNVIFDKSFIESAADFCVKLWLFLPKKLKFLKIWIHIEFLRAKNGKQSSYSRWNDHDLRKNGVYFSAKIWLKNGKILDHKMKIFFIHRKTFWMTFQNYERNKKFDCLEFQIKSRKSPTEISIIFQIRNGQLTFLEPKSKVNSKCKNDF